MASWSEDENAALEALVVRNPGCSVVTLARAFSQEHPRRSVAAAKVRIYSLRQRLLQAALQVDSSADETPGLLEVTLAGCRPFWATVPNAALLLRALGCAEAPASDVRVYLDRR